MRVYCQTVGIHLFDKTVWVGKEDVGNYGLGSRHRTFKWLHWYDCVDRVLLVTAAFCWFISVLCADGAFKITAQSNFSVTSKIWNSASSSALLILSTGTSRLITSSKPFYPPSYLPPCAADSAFADIVHIYNFYFYRASICKGGLGSRNSVCPSVRPSVTRVDCDKTKWRTADIFIPRERAITLLLWHQQWLMGDAPFPLKSVFKVTHPLRKTPTSTDFRS